MRTAFFIAMRELWERRTVLAAALVAGLLAFAGPLLPGVGAANAVEARDALAAILTLGFGAVLAVLLGATAVARDLAENRLAFDFARPISGLAIWSGRIGAAAVLTLAAMLVVAAPASLVGGHLALTDSGETIWQHWPKILGAVLLLVPLAHVASVAFRSRSRWLALDLVGFVVVLLLTASGVRHLHEAFVVQTGYVVALGAAMITIPALWIASAAQVLRGRTDIVLGHRAQSVALWSMLLVVASGVFGYGLWFVAAGVDDFDDVWAQPAPRGSWVTLVGTMRGRPGLHAEFLVDTESGRTVRLGPLDPQSYDATIYSSDGRRAVSFDYEATAAGTFDVSLIDLNVPEPRVRETTIAFDWLSGTALSPSGARLLTLQGQQIAVHDLESGRILAAARLATSVQSWRGGRVTFLDENRIRIYGFVDPDRLVAYEFDIDARALTSWIGPAVGWGYQQLDWSHDHTRLILSSQESLGVLLLDAESGATIAAIASPDEKPEPSCAFLHDGRIVRLAGSGGDRLSLDVLSADGGSLDSFDLGDVDPADELRLGAEAAPGTLLVGRSGRGGVDATLMLVDLSGGAIREVEGGGWPVAANSRPMLSLPAQPGSIAARLVQRHGSVWLLDAESATLRHVAGTLR